MIVNYDHFNLDPSVADSYAQMVRQLSDRYYHNVTRYGGASFLRSKLGPALMARGVAPHIYDNVRDAQAHVRG